MQNTFADQQFSKIRELLISQLHKKPPTTRLRTLLVIHFLLQSTNPTLQSWFTSYTLQIDANKSCEYHQLYLSYYTYLKSKYKSPHLIPDSSFNLPPSDLINKTEEILKVLQDLLSLKKPLLGFHKNKEKLGFLTEIVTRIFIDSKELYSVLKNLMTCIWNTYTEFNAFLACQAEAVFLKYNKATKRLKGFAHEWTEEYPGEIQKYQMLNEDCLKEVQRVVRGKENLNTGVNLIGFETVTNSSTPAKENRSLSLEGAKKFQHERQVSCPQEVNNFAPVYAPQVFGPLNPMQMMNNLQCYAMYNTMYPNQMFYQNFMPK